MAGRTIAACKAPIAILVLCMTGGSKVAQAQSAESSITVSAQVLSVTPSAEGLAAVRSLLVTGSRSLSHRLAEARLTTESAPKPVGQSASTAPRSKVVVTIEFLRN